VVFWHRPPKGFADEAMKLGWLPRGVLPLTYDYIGILSKQQGAIWNKDLAYPRMTFFGTRAIELCVKLSSEDFNYGALLDPFCGDGDLGIVGQKLRRRTILIGEECKEVKERLDDASSHA